MDTFGRPASRLGTSVDCPLDEPLWSLYRYKRCAPLSTKLDGFETGFLCKVTRCCQEVLSLIGVSVAHGN